MAQFQLRTFLPRRDVVLLTFQMNALREYKTDTVIDSSDTHAKVMRSLHHESQSWSPGHA